MAASMVVMLLTTDLPDSGRYQGFEVFKGKANMIKTTLTIACAIVALAISTNANAQDCGSCGGGYAMGSAVDFGGYGNYGNYGVTGVTGLNECGRDYTNQQAAGLWAGYCTDVCSTQKRQRCGLFGKKCGGGRLGAGGCNSGGCGGGNIGCFGYPSGGCGGGCNSGCGGGCNSGCGSSRGFSLFSRLKSFGGGFGGRCNSGCQLFTKMKSGGGCSFFSKFRCRKNDCQSICGAPVTSIAVDQCGCGNSGQYFDYAVGAEYGNAGMQSNFSGMLTGACCGG